MPHFNLDFKLVFVRIAGVSVKIIKQRIVVVKWPEDEYKVIGLLISIGY